MSANTSNLFNKCANPFCACKVEAGELYCSHACASLEEQFGERCLCGHPECAGAEAAVEGGELDVPLT